MHWSRKPGPNWILTYERTSTGQAEEILVRDYAAAFVFHPLTMQLRKSNLKGYSRYPDGTVGGLMFSRLYKSRK